MKVVKPKQQQLKEAQESSSAAQALWDSALDRLRAVEAEMKKLMDEFEATKAEEDKLKAQKPQDSTDFDSSSCHWLTAEEMDTLRRDDD